MLPNSANIIYVIGKKNREDEEFTSLRYPIVIIGSGITAINAAIRSQKNNIPPVIVADNPLGQDYYEQMIVLAAFVEASKMNKTKAEVLEYIKKSSTDAKLEIQKTIVDQNDIKIIEGKPKFQDHNTIEITSEDTSSTIEAKKIIIAQEAIPKIPKIDGLDEIDYFTYETLLEIEEIPDSVTILGAGIFGLEMAEALLNLGVKVNIISKGFLPFGEEECTKVIFEKVFYEKVTYVDGEVKRFSKNDNQIVAHTSEGLDIASEMLIVATGKKGNVNSLNLEKASVEYENTGILVDEFLRTTRNNIHAAGGSIRYRSEYQAGQKDGILAVNNASYDIAAQKYDAFYCWGVNLSTPLAQVGVNEELATKVYKGEIDVFTVDLTNYSSATYDENSILLMKIILNKNKLVSACLVGGKALEAIGILAYAVQRSLPLVEISSLTPPGLGQLDDIFQALSDIAYEKHKDSFNYKFSNWASTFFLFRWFGKFLRR